MSDRSDKSTPGTMARLESLESRLLLSGPSPREQQMLELINRFRTRPAQELPLLLKSTDPNIQGALSYFGVNQTVLAQQWKALTPQEPLAWSDTLARAALTHNQRMLAAQTQAHQLPGEAALIQRTAAAGYANAAFVGENIFAWAYSAGHAHAGFAIDWGNAPSGIQNPPGHRNNLMAGVYREVGLSMLDAPAGKSVGPILVGQDFGVRRNQGNPFLLGAVYDDKNRDSFYTAGEGLANVTILAAGKAGIFSTISMTAGGYQMQLPAGSYTLSAAGAGGTMSLGTVTVAADNIKSDFVRSRFVPDTLAPGSIFKLTGIPVGGQSSVTFTVTYADNGAINVSTIATGDIRIVGPGAAVATPALVSLSRSNNGPSVTATYRFDAPGGFFDSADNGTYNVNLRPSQIADASGLFVPSRTLGAITVAVPQAVLTPAGTLLVNGTAAGDSIALWRDSSSHYARVNRSTFSFPSTAVRRIFAVGQAGNDTITLARNLMGSTIDGGPGNDTLFGTDGGDTLQGQEGDDLIYGFGGNDLFRARPGRDTLIGGAGFDSAQSDAADFLREIEKVL